MRRQLALALGLFGMLTLCSCSSTFPTPETLNTASRSYQAPAGDIVAALPTALAAEPMKLAVADSRNGTLQTSWKEGYRGEFHIARYWQERSRFLVSVSPEWQNPQGVSRIDVREETQERSNSRANWSTAQHGRPERAAALLAHLEAKLAIPAAPAAPALPSAAPALPSAGADLPPAARPAGQSMLSIPGTVEEAAARVTAAAKNAGLQTVWEKKTADRAVMQLRKASGPVATVTCEPRPGKLVRITVREPEGEADPIGAALLTALQTK
jgi:hypothetical protein